MNKDTVTKILLWAIGAAFSTIVGIIMLFLNRTLSEIDATKKATIATKEKFIELKASIQNLSGEVISVKNELRAIKKQLRYSLLDSKTTDFKTAFHLTEEDYEKTIFSLMHPSVTAIR